VVKAKRERSSDVHCDPTPIDSISLPLMKITVLGAGAIGSAVACDLVARPEVTHLQVIDHKASTLATVSGRAASPKLRTVRIDVRDERRLAAVLAGSACVVSSVHPKHHPKLARLALDVGAHFCDLGGDDSTTAAALALHDEAAARSRWVVPNCGFAPGLVNILVMRGVESFEEVDSVLVRAGNIPVHAEPPFFHRLAYSAEKLLDDYNAPAPLVRDGQVVHVEPLSGLEMVSFDPPFETLEAFYTSGKLSTLPEDLAGRVRTLDYKTLRHPGHAAAMRSVLALGFGEDKSIDVRTHLTYRDVLARRLRSRLGGKYEDAVLLRIRIAGVSEGERCVMVHELVELYDRENGSTAMQRCTGYPTAAVAVLLATGQIPGGGAAPPERIVPREAFYHALTDRGLTIRARLVDPDEELRADHGGDGSPGRTVEREL
jgi:lysine 6-dehydrogenase